MDEFETFYRLGLALGIGLLIGTERGWHTRDDLPGQRVAGVRTFALIGLLGGLAGLLSNALGELVVVAALLVLGALSVAAYVVCAATNTDDRGFTTEIAQLVTFLLGATAVLGDMALAAIAAVVTVALLQAKPELHGLIRQLDRLELNSAIRLLVLSVVALPLLPDRGFGPGGIINPLQLWWMVVSISAVSFVGYFAIKLLGPRAGPLVSGALGGLASSTAVTVSFARMAQKDAASSAALAAGIAIAGAVMFLRVPVVAALADRQLAADLAAPLVVMAAVVTAVTLLIARGTEARTAAVPAEIRDPSNIATALKFGALLLAITVVSHVLQERFGARGLYAVALAAGLADVDAITLTIARALGEPTSRTVAVRAILLAVLANTAVKVVIAAAIAGMPTAWRVGAALGAGFAAGFAAIALL